MQNVNQDIVNRNVFETAELKPVPKVSAKTKPKFILFKNPKVKKIVVITLLSIFGFLALVSIFLLIFAYIPGKKVYADLTSLKNKQDQVKNALDSKNLDLMEAQIKQFETDINNLDSDYQKLKTIGSLPVIKSYYQDGQVLLDAGKQSLQTGQILIEAIKPYQDFLGLKAEATSSADTTEDRIAFLTESVEGLLPHLDEIEQKLSSIKSLVSQIDSNKYPITIQNFEVRQNIIKVQNSLDEIYTFLKDGRPILENVSWLLGKDSPRKYFLLFQNDAELRPSGGFWTAYGILKVDNGKVTPLISDDIYSLDDKFKSTIPAPRPIKDYHINIPYWYLRDMNISPDFPTNAQTFLENYQKISSETFDAIIAIDTAVLVDLVDVLGRIGVPGYGNFSAEPDKRCYGCPQIIYQLEYIAGKPRSYIADDRKGFLAPLMHSILSNAMGAPKEKITPLAEAFFKNIHNKHIIFYFLDDQLQQAGNLANITASIQKTDANTDYLHLNDSNMASAKTNLFLEQTIKHQIISKDSQVSHQVTVTYTNPYKASNCNLEKGDLCLNAPKYRNWFRFYTPTGSTLIKMTGSEIQPLKYEELDKQVFEGFYGDKYPLYSQSSTKVTIQYISSVPASKDYQLLLQKQAGTKPVTYQLVVNGVEMEPFSWVSDKLLKLPL